MYISNAIQEPGMKKFFSSEFGFLHAIVVDGKLWFNMTDPCSALRMALRDAKNECELAAVRCVNTMYGELNSQAVTAMWMKMECTPSLSKVVRQERTLIVNR